MSSVSSLEYLVCTVLEAEVQWARSRGTGEVWGTQRLWAHVGENSRATQLP